MKLGLQLGYWGAQPPQGVGELVEEAERAGFEAVFAAEAWGSDAFTPLAWWGHRTSTIKLGTSIVQLSGRTPTSCAMHALTLDHLSGGRVILGLGVSGPQVVEGWYGRPFSKPLARTREYIDIIRQVMARKAPVTNEGPHYPLPYTGEGAVGLGKPLKPITHPLRADLPIWMGAEGPKNVALAAEIADGWLPIYFSPRMADMYRSWLDEGFARPGARRTRETFEIAATCQLVVTPDGAAKQATFDAMRPRMALYIGGMGAKEQNFHKAVFDRMGYQEVADRIQELYLEGRKDEAAALVPDELIAEVTIIGSRDEVRDQVERWEEAGVTMLVLNLRSPEEVRQVAEAVLG
ncbi:MAG TPA: LLM class F420-dependent oxidoreductase [Nocardioidaceae bacterium]|nr:LLM class F420-dependent oxidoreductase [Nocardioidaceae bacterium]